MKKSCLSPFYSQQHIFMIKVIRLQKSIVNRKVKIKECSLVITARLKIL